MSVGRGREELTTIAKSLHDLGNGTPLLTNGDVDDVELLLLVVAVVEPLLVDDCVYGNSGLTASGGGGGEMAGEGENRDQSMNKLNTRSSRRKQPL